MLKQDDASDFIKAMEKNKMITHLVVILFFFHCFNKIGSIILFQHLTKCVVFIVLIPSSKNHVMNLIQ